MNARELLADATERLKAAGCDTPRLDAEVLLMHAWGRDKAGLVMAMDDMPEAGTTRMFRTMIKRREHREPVAYIIGMKEFWSRCFHVTPDVLIPRPETEHLIEAVLKAFPDRNVPYSFCDVGTGSGCIAVTLACEYTQATVVATDISKNALALTCKNAVLHGVRDRIVPRHGDMFRALAADDGPFIAVISNPPYVSVDEYQQLEPELAFEPRMALTDEADGLQYLRQLIDTAPGYLEPGGRLIVETGLCGLPQETAAMRPEQKIIDLAGQLRGCVYRHLTSSAEPQKV